MHIRDVFAAFSTRIANAAGRPWAFVLAFFLIVVWAVTGPAFGFSETWQLVVNTGTTIVTFLMVFVLQNSQNRDGQALHAKLDEIILSGHAENSFIEAEKLSEREVIRLRELIEASRDSAE